MHINLITPMPEREKIRAELVKEIMVAWVSKTVPTGFTIKEMVDTSVRLFDTHIPLEKDK